MPKKYKEQTDYERDLLNFNTDAWRGENYRRKDNNRRDTKEDALMPLDKYDVPSFRSYDDVPRDSKTAHHRKSRDMTAADRDKIVYLGETWKGDDHSEKELSKRRSQEWVRKTNRHRKTDDVPEQPIGGYRMAHEWAQKEPEATKHARGRDGAGREAWTAQDDHGNDFETYAYEHKKQAYASPNVHRRGRANEYATHERRDSHGGPRYSPDNIDRRHRKESTKHRERTHLQPRMSRRGTASREDPGYYDDTGAMVKAAVKIQSAFRGYRTRKDFWKQRERMRRQSSIHTKQQYRHDERSIPSVTSIVDDESVSALSTNADPNIGLVPPMPTLDITQKNNVLRELKAKLGFEEIASVNQLQTETSPIIVLLGGLNPIEAKNYILGGIMFVYNVQKDKWFFGGTMPEPRNYHATACLNGKIYVTGGYNPVQAVHGHMISTPSTLQLTVRSKRWRKRADMHQARSCHGLCLIGETIVVLGGRDASGKLLATVERYFPKRDQWALMKSMPEPIMGMGCTVLDGCIWVIGGVVNDGHPSRFAVSNRCYTFDIEKQTWFRQIPLPEGRAFSCAATLKREVWLWCGVKDALNEDGYLLSTNTVFVYNPEQVNWEQHSSVGTAKHAAALVKIGRRTFILGGMTNSSGSKEVLNENDFFDRENDRYMEGAPLPFPLTGAAAVALPIEYVGTSDPKWHYENLNEEVLNEAAIKIQSAYRGYRTRSLISDNKLPIFDRHAEMRARLDSYGRPELITNKWKLFQRVQIDEWPPIPSPQQSSSDMNIKLGTQPKGYTVSASSTAGRMKVRRYVSLPPHVDPNLSMCGHLCNIYKKAKKILGLRKVENLPAFAENLVTVTTLQDDSVPVILIIGGLQPKDPVNLSNGKLILRYHVLKNTWEYFGALPEPRNYHAAVYYHDHIYVTGGCDPDQRNSGEMVSTNTVYCLNIHSSEWVQKADMHCCRAYHSLVAAFNRLFAIGGRDHNGRLIASIESYDIEKDKWSMMRPMTSPRMGMACVLYEDHIWCMGGIGISEDGDAVSYPVLSSVVSYDLINDNWISRPPLRCPRAFASCVIVDNCLWLCGGASRDRISNCLISMGSIDKYYPTEAEWVRETLINNPRHCAAVVSVESCIYIFGGVSSQEWSALSKNEMIVINDISLHSAIELPIPLTGLSAVAIPPASPSLRSISLSMLLHNKLTFH